MSARPRRRRSLEPEAEHDNSERWMASYMDMVTVLMCMFIVLFSMSVVDKTKYQELRNSLATGFGTTKTEKIDAATGVVVTPDKVNKKAEGFTQAKSENDIKLAEREVDELTQLEKQIQQALAAQGLQPSVAFTLDERGLTIRLVGSETFFETNRVDLTDKAVAVLNAVAPPLAASTYNISIEGHADERAAAYPYPTNWELSTGRATRVLRHLVESNGIAPTRVEAVGYGDSRPLAPGDAPDALATNRRVDIVVLSTQPEEVRALIPGIVASRGASGSATGPP